MQTHNIVLTGAGILTAILIATSTVAYMATTDTLTAVPEPVDVQTPELIQAGTSAELEMIFEQHGYQWPPSNITAVPSIVVMTLPEDIVEITDVNRRKSLFLRSLLPIVLLENRRLREQRSMLEVFFKQGVPQPGSEAHDWLLEISQSMKVRGQLTDPQTQQTLLRRLDEIPATMTLAQAAIESGWGTSRFALEGNSLFGQWTYSTSRGIAPTDRDEDATHLVRAFPDLQASVRAYMRNLNTNRAYREFRDARAEMRDRGEDLSAVELVKHLHRYSQRGLEYVEELQKIIKGRTLAEFDIDPPPVKPERLASLIQNLAQDPS